MDQLKPITVMFTEEEIATLSFALGVYVGTCRTGDKVDEKVFRGAQSIMERINVARDRAGR